ncbi:hypothetical protein [Sulfitobacter sp. MF3-043]|uniref:hypothetical protein n=1 Tax=Sulfitobacter sediminivivens TaxID=3252902 RepID=UPI0036DD667D
MVEHSTRSWTLKLAAGVAIVFGTLTILSGGQALFGSVAMRDAVGDAVPFVLWFNFLSGFFYILTGIGIAMGRRWAARMAVYIALAIAAVFALFGLHILQGGAFEMRTVGAMTLRLIVWIIVATVAVRNLPVVR